MKTTIELSRMDQDIISFALEDYMDKLNNQRRELLSKGEVSKATELQRIIDNADSIWERIESLATA